MVQSRKNNATLGIPRMNKSYLVIVDPPSFRWKLDSTSHNRSSWTVNAFGGNPVRYILSSMGSWSTSTYVVVGRGGIN